MPNMAMHQTSLRRSIQPLEWNDEVEAFAATCPQLNYQL